MAASVATTDPMAAQIVRQGTGREGAGGSGDIAGQRTQGLTCALDMGQPIVVTQKQSSTDGVLRFEINRSLTGMGHERYTSAADATGPRPPDVLAKRLLERGGVKAVSVYSNMVTVELAAGDSGDGILELVEQLFIHYREGVQPSVP
jgi:hypothetical protein